MREPACEDEDEDIRSELAINNTMTEEGRLFIMVENVMIQAQKESTGG